MSDYLPPLRQDPSNDVASRLYAVEILKTRKVSGRGAICRNCDGAEYVLVKRFGKGSGSSSVIDFERQACTHCEGGRVNVTRQEPTRAAGTVANSNERWKSSQPSRRAR